MKLRGGKISKYTPRKTGGFNVKSRADMPDRSNILITSDPALQTLGKSYGVIVLSAGEAPATLVNAYHYEQILDRLLALGGVRSRGADLALAEKYLLLGHGPNYLYYAQAPLPTRERRANAAKPKPDANFALSPGTDQLEICAMWNGPVTGGLEAPSRDGAMGGSALNYVKSVFDEAWADERKWEWLHVVGHALGGNNEVGNLVAGTFDANTQMIPMERAVQQLSQKAGELNPVEARYVVTLYPDTWVAIDIQMMYHGCGALTGWRTFPATTMLVFDKLQYDIWAQ